MPRTSPFRSVLDFDSESSLTIGLESSNVGEDGFKDWMLPNYNSDRPYITVADEAKRLQVLKSYLILNSVQEEDFDSLAAQVREEYDASWSCISLVDMGRQWYKAYDGHDIELTETSRQSAFCSHTILEEDGLLVVPDTHQDDRFRNSPFTTSGQKLRFYAGAALVSPEGTRLGALCIMDNKPRPQGLTKKEGDYLKTKAEETVRLIVERKERMENGNDAKRTARCLAGSPKNQSLKKKSLTHQGKDCMSLLDALVARPRTEVVVPGPNTSNVDPDEYLAQLMQALWGVSVSVKPARDLKSFFPSITEEQMGAYGLEVVAATRENKVDKLRELLVSHGRESLDCFNRFGEGLINIACRRGFQDIVKFLLSDEVGLSFRTCDDGGRTPLHDACWHPSPQLEICTQIIEQEPALFLVGDNRGFTAFHYARKDHWHIWRQFLFDNRGHLEPLARSANPFL
jgi:hypothetical protein